MSGGPDTPGGTTPENRGNRPQHPMPPRFPVAPIASGLRPYHGRAHRVERLGSRENRGVVRSRKQEDSGKG